MGFWVHQDMVKEASVKLFMNRCMDVLRWRDVLWLQLTSCKLTAIRTLADTFDS